MRLWLGALCALLFTGPAFAQPAALAPSRCGELQGAPPALPDGAVARPAEMEATNQAFTAWATGAHAVLECRRAEVEELRAAANQRANEYSTGADLLNAAIASWQAEVDEFNARTSRR